MRPTAEHTRLRSAARGRAMPGLVEARALLRGAAVIVALSGLAGCTGDADADPSPTTAVTGEPTASASAVAEVEKPQRPAAMERDDAEGAAAAAEYFIELYPYVMATGDTEEFESMSHEACGFCSQTIEDVERLEDDNETYIGGGSSSSVIETFAQDALTGVFPLDIRVVQDASEIIASDGTVVSSLAETTSDLRVEISREAQGWVVVEVASTPGASE